MPLNKAFFVSEFFLWNKIMCFLVFISHSFLLLLHVNHILSTTFAHKTTTWRILRCSFLPKPYIILYVFKDIFWDLQSEIKNKNHVDICPKQMHLGNSSDSLNRYIYTYKTWKKKRQQRQTTLWQTTLWGDSKSWVLFDWINHFAYAHESKTYRSLMQCIWDEERSSLIILSQG